MPHKTAALTPSNPVKAGVYRRTKLLANETWFTQEQLDTLLKRARRRRTAEQLRTSRKLIGVQIQGVYLYPTAQLDAVTGSPKPVMAKLLSIIPPDTSEWETIMWLFASRRDLNGGRPADHLATRPEAAIQAARDDFQPPPSSW